MSDTEADLEARLRAEKIHEDWTQRVTALYEQIRRCFSPNSVVTILVRDPNRPEEAFCVSQEKNFDVLRGALDALEKRGVKRDVVQEKKILDVSGLTVKVEQK